MAEAATVGHLEGAADLVSVVEGVGARLAQE